MHCPINISFPFRSFSAIHNLSSVKFLTFNTVHMTETDIEDILNEVPLKNEQGTMEEGLKADRILGGSDTRQLRFSNVLGNYKLPNVMRYTWIPYCNNIMCSSSEVIYGNFCELYKAKAELPSELVEWMGMCGRIRESAIQSFLKARKESPSFVLFNKDLDQLIYDIVSEWNSLLYFCWFCVSDQVFV